MKEHKQILLDAGDAYLLSKHKWWTEKHGRTFYAYTIIGEKKIFIHQLICPSENPLITSDHRDRNGLNNQRSNLRLANKSQQQENRGKTSSQTSSKYKGVTWKSNRGKWNAQIEKSVNGKRKSFHLGSFNSELEAALAYNEMALELFGEFACINEVNNEGT